MAFSEVELSVIDRTVGALCRRLSSSAPADELRFSYAVDGHAVVMYEERAPWHPEGEGWSRMPIARFRLYRRREEWFLYWMRASGQWDYYEGPRRQLKTLVRYVADDEYGCFFG